MRGIDTSLAIKEQVDLYTPREVIDLGSGDFLAFNSETLSGRQQIISNPAIRRLAMRSRAYSAMGTMDAGGGLEFTASNFVLDKLLPLIFHEKDGDADDESGDGATYTLVGGGQLTPFTVFVGFDGPEGAYTRRFTGAKVNTATFSARVNDMLRVNLNLAAINKELIDNAPTAVYPGGDDEYAFVYDQAEVMLKAGDMSNLVAIPVESFDLTINHNLNTGAYRLGSAYRRSLQESQTDVEGTFTLDASTEGLGGTALALSGSDHDPAFFERVAREARYAALRLTVVDTSKVLVEGAGSDPDVYCSLVIDLPFVRLEEPDFQVRDSGLITGSARFVAYDDLTVTHKATFGAVPDPDPVPNPE
jgi:hypothetical protein